MIIISIILGSISLTIALISFIMILSIVQEKVKTPPNITIQHDNSPMGDKYEDYQQGWNDAVTYMLANINITMFDLYRTNDVLDYHSHLESFQNRMNYIVSNKEYQEEVVQEFNKYTKGKE